MREKENQERVGAENPASTFTWDTLRKDARLFLEGTPHTPAFSAKVPAGTAAGAACDSNVLFNFLTTIKISPARACVREMRWNERCSIK